MDHVTGLHKCHAKQKHTCQREWENRLGQCLLLKMKGLLPVVAVVAVVPAATENRSIKYVFDTRSVDTDN